jgi:drug/metabolite transporter (DMT)-like permease
MSRLTRGYLIALTGTVIWSTTGILIRYLNVHYGMPPLILAFWRDLFAALVVALVFLFFTPRLFRVPRPQIGFLVLYGFVLAVFNSLWTISVSLNGAAVSTVLAYSSPAFTALFAWRLLGEKLDRARLGIIGLSFIGCIFVAGAHDPQIWRLNPLGIVTGLLSGVAFAVYSLMGKSASNRGLNSWTALCYTFAFAAVFLLGFNLVSGQAKDLMWLKDSPDGWGILLLLAAGPTLGGYGLYTLSLNYLPAAVANLIATLEPSFTAVQSYLLLGERFTLPQVGGALLVIASVILLRLVENRRQAANPKQPQQE